MHLIYKLVQNTMSTIPKKIPSTLPQFLWHFTKRYKVNLLGLVFVAMYWAANLSLSPYAMKLIIDQVSDATLKPENLFEAVHLPIIFYITLSFLIGAVFRFYDWLIIKTFPKMKSEITAEMFDYVENHSYSYFQHNFSGSLANKINDMAKGAVLVISQLIDHFLARILCLLIGATTMFLVHPYFSYLLLIWGALFTGASLFLSKKAQVYSKIFSESRSAVVGKIVDALSNILNIKLFAREGYESRYLRKYLDDSAEKDRALHWYLLKVKALYGISITALIACMTWLLVYERTQNRITIGDFALILTLTGSLIEEVFFIANQLVTFSEEIGTCTQALSIISPPHDIVDAPNASALQVTKGEIVFDKVHFKYKKSDAIFADKSITIRPGEKVGLVGYSGSGKSTFINLILRFFEVDSGAILIDGQDIKKVSQGSLRSQIAMIPQDPLLFHRTLLENIRYGRLDATDEEVRECAKRAHCSEFIAKQKEGYDGLVGERGVKLSGGQRQRIAIARAILKNAPILILDEATSSLDSVTEELIQESLNDLMTGRTTIVIAHRLSTLFHMDRILVFSEGKIVEDGTHETLIRMNGQYAKLWSMQAGGFLIDSKNSNG